MLHKCKIILTLVLLTAAGLTSCQTTATPTLATLSEPGIAVGISDDICPTVIVKTGQQVSWTNQGKQEHIVRAQSSEGETLFELGPLQPGDSGAVTMTQQGTYTYECSADGSLTGTLTVEP